MGVTNTTAPKNPHRHLTVEQVRETVARMDFRDEDRRADYLAQCLEGRNDFTVLTWAKRFGIK